MSERRLIVDTRQLPIIIERLCAQLMEAHGDFSQTVIIGLQPRGTTLAARIHQKLTQQRGHPITFGLLDVTFYRDDFRRNEKPLIPSETRIDFSIEGKKVVLIDDVFYTGRTIRAGLDALLDFGRPAKVELLALIERRYAQEFPVKPDYLGKHVNTTDNEKVLVEWAEMNGKDNVWIISQ